MAHPLSFRVADRIPDLGGLMLDVKQLYELQVLDLKLAELERSVSEILAALADRAEIDRAAGLVQELEARMGDASFKRRVVDGKVAELQAGLDRLDLRLYGGGVTNAQQLAAAQEERNFTQQQHGEEEDRLLDIMVEIEELEPALDEAREILERLEADRPIEEAEWRRTESLLNEELSTLGLKREELQPLVSPNLLPLYESLCKSKAGYAVAKVSRGMCQGCRLALPTMEMQRARTSQTVPRCSSCGRILFAD